MTDTSLISHSSDEPAPAAAGAERRRSRGFRRQWESSPHAPRFRVAIVVLSGLALAAVVAAIAIGSHGRDSSSSSAQQWSLWKPTDSGNQGAREIADYLAPTYRISAANQLDVITVVNLQSQAAQEAAAQAQANGTTASAQSGLQVAVRPSLSSSQVRLLGGNTIAYNLCGIGAKNCSIGTGKPSPDRLLLLRREALELALYTFKYLTPPTTCSPFCPRATLRRRTRCQSSCRRATHPPQPSRSRSPSCSSVRNSRRCSTTRST